MAVEMQGYNGEELHPAIAKRIETLRKFHNYDPGAPLTPLRYDNNGVAYQHFYMGKFEAPPELDEAWFTQEIEGSFPPAQG